MSSILKVSFLLIFSVNLKIVEANEKINLIEKRHNKLNLEIKESRIRAAIIYQLLKYIEFPKTINSKDILFCIENKNISIFKNILNNKVINKRKIKVNNYINNDCNVVYSKNNLKYDSENVKQLYITNKIDNIKMISVYKNNNSLNIGFNLKSLNKNSFKINKDLISKAHKIIK